MAKRRSPRAAADAGPIVRRDLVLGDAAMIRAGAVLDGVRFDGIDLSGDDLTGSSFLECELADLRAHETQLRATTLTDVVFRRLDAPALSAARSRWRDVELSESRIGSLDLAGATWQSVLIRGCKLGFVNLRGADIGNVVVEHCTIDELDLGAATAARVTFIGTRIGTLDLSGARLSAVDLRGADLHRITNLPGLAGSTMDDAQVQALATSFATHLGITIDGAAI